MQATQLRTKKPTDRRSVKKVIKSIAAPGSAPSAVAEVKEEVFTESVMPAANYEPIAIGQPAAKRARKAKSSSESVDKSVDKSIDQQVAERVAERVAEQPVAKRARKAKSSSESAVSASAVNEAPILAEAVEVASVVDDQSSMRARRAKPTRDETLELLNATKTQLGEYAKMSRNGKYQVRSDQLRSLHSNLKTAINASSRLMKKSTKRAENPNIANRKPSGFGKPTLISDALADFGGWEHGSRVPPTDVTTKIWDYIKSNNLQNPDRKSEIIVDSKLATIYTPEIMNGQKLTNTGIQKYIQVHYNRNE